MRVSFIHRKVGGGCFAGLEWLTGGPATAQLATCGNNRAGVLFCQRLALRDEIERALRRDEGNSEQSFTL